MRNKKAKTNRIVVERFSVNGNAIANRMDRIKKLFLSAGYPEKAADEAAFHIADMLPDYARLYSFFLELTLGNKKVSKRKLEDARDMLDYHIMYHIKKLNVCLRKMAWHKQDIE